jgi:hypothetical protein
LVGKGEFNGETNFLIARQGDAHSIIEILKLLLSSAEEVQQQIISNLLFLWLKSTRNIYLCRESSPMLYLIQLLQQTQNDRIFGTREKQNLTIPEKTLLLLQILGKFSFAVQPLKQYLALLTSSKLEAQKKVYVAFQTYQ